MSTQYLHDATLEFLNESPSPENKTILDFGCGDGFASVEFKKRGAAHVLAFDKNEALKDAILQEGIGFGQPFLGEQYDIIWCHHVLEHIETPIRFLNLFKKYMSGNSELWLSTPNFTHHDTYDLSHIVPYNMPVLVEHLRLAGFDTSAGSYRTTGKHAGHLRVRIKPYPFSGKSCYPKPMADEMSANNRCDAFCLERWNW